MWICFSNAFVSVVKNRNDTTTLLVRARRRNHLKNLLGDKAEIFSLPNRDYKYRAIVNRDEFAKLVAKRISEIDYGNFKDSVEDDELHDLYAGFWMDHADFQR